MILPEVIQNTGFIASPGPFPLWKEILNPFCAARGGSVSLALLPWIQGHAHNQQIVFRLASAVH